MLTESIDYIGMPHTPKSTWTERQRVMWMVRTRIPGFWSWSCHPLTVCSWGSHALFSHLWSEFELANPKAHCVPSWWDQVPPSLPLAASLSGRCQGLDLVFASPQWADALWDPGGWWEISNLNVRALNGFAVFCVMYTLLVATASRSWMNTRNQTLWLPFWRILAVLMSLVVVSSLSFTEGDRHRKRKSLASGHIQKAWGPLLKIS